MDREITIECYMFNSKKVLAELLYDTITKYENKKCTTCKHCDDAQETMIHCEYFEEFLPVGMSCENWEQKVGNIHQNKELLDD